MNRGVKDVFVMAEDDSDEIKTLDNTEFLNNYFGKCIFALMK